MQYQPPVDRNFDLMKLTMPCHHSSPWGAPRRGFTLFEVTIAAVALGLVALGIVQGTVALERARRATEQIDYASREMDNLMQQFTTQAPNAVTAGAARALQFPPEVATRLPAHSLETTVANQADPTAKRITMRLTWSPPAKAPPMVLVAWVMDDTATDGEGQP